MKNLLNRILTFTFFLFTSTLSYNCNSSKPNTAEMKDNVIAYLKARHNVEILNVKIQYKRNAGNFMDKKIPYEVRYTTEELHGRTAFMSFYNVSEMDVQYDTYSEELLSVIAGQNIEKESSDIPFVVYIRMMGGVDKLDWIRSNYPLNELQKMMFKGIEFQILVLVTAMDIKENKRKYEEFHIEIMRLLKEQSIEKGSLRIIFLDDKIDLEKSRISSATPIVASHPIKQHTLQRWSTIHNIKWYDMVKDRPDKVLKYGKIYDK